MVNAPCKLWETFCDTFGASKHEIIDGIRYEDDADTYIHALLTRNAKQIRKVRASQKKVEEYMESIKPLLKDLNNNPK